MKVLQDDKTYDVSGLREANHKKLGIDNPNKNTR